MLAHLILTAVLDGREQCCSHYKIRKPKGQIACLYKHRCKIARAEFWIQGSLETVSFFVFEIGFFCIGLAVLDLLCRLGWLPTQGSSCLCLQSAELKYVCYHDQTGDCVLNYHAIFYAPSQFPEISELGVWSTDNCFPEHIMSLVDFWLLLFYSGFTSFSKK